MRAQAEATKASKAADLAAEVERLKAENDALRAALAGYQQCGPAEVTLNAPAAAGEEGAAAAAGAGSLTKPLIPLAQQLEEGIQWPSPEEGSFWERPPRAAPLALAPPRGAAPSGQRDPRSVHVVHITAEMAPHAKVGGLGDVVTGLAKACLARGHNVEIMLPVRPAAAAAHFGCCWPDCAGEGGLLVQSARAGCVRELPRGCTLCSRHGRHGRCLRRCYHQHVWFCSCKHAVVQGAHHTHQWPRKLSLACTLRRSTTSAFQMMPLRTCSMSATSSALRQAVERSCMQSWLAVCLCGGAAGRSGQLAWVRCVRHSRACRRCRRLAVGRNLWRHATPCTGVLGF